MFNIRKKMRVTGIFEDRQKKVISFGRIKNTIQYFPKFRLIKAEYN